MASILLIEDYQSLQQIYKETLELEKHKVFVAMNAQEALEVAKNNHFDVILLDLLLQETSGLDFLAGFNPKDHPDTQIIIISNLYANDILNKALKLGAKHYLMKSEVTPQQLADVVRETLEQSAKTPPGDNDTLSVKPHEEA